MKQVTLQRELRITADGSHTFYVPTLDEHFHSIHGALSESMHVFIQHGYNKLISDHHTVSICEVGLGTGLNALLTYKRSRETGHQILYMGIEPYPLTMDEVNQLNIAEMVGHGIHADFFRQLHQTPANKIVELAPGFLFKRIEKVIQDAYLPPDLFNLVYFDAFGPQVQAELWTEDVFLPIYQSMKHKGVLTTYSAKGSVKRALKKCGFQLDHPAGPAGKREMTRAVKP